MWASNRPNKYTLDCLEAINFLIEELDRVRAENCELTKKIDTAIESLSEIASWCPTPDKPAECKIAECHYSRDALKKIQSKEPHEWTRVLREDAENS